MTITIQKVSLRHRSGSKEYHLLLVQNGSNGKGLLVNRWGKTGAWGQMKTERHTETGARSAFDNKIHEKETRGYKITANKVEDVLDVEAAQRSIGMTYWPQMGADNLQHVFPGVDTTGVREAKPIEWKETPDGKFVAENKPQFSMPSPEEELAEKKSNPNWGLF